MAEYLYTRTLDTNTNLYNIDYAGELIRLSANIKTNFPSKTLIKTECNVAEFKVIIEPALSAGDKTILDGLIGGYVSEVIKDYRLYCNICSEYRCVYANDIPTECPNSECASSDITDIVNQDSWSEVTDENGNVWGIFILVTGELVVARRY